MAQILVFGDSIACGAGDEEGGWVNRLRKFFDERPFTSPDFYCLVYNLAVSGDSSGDLLERFEFETKQRLKEREDTIFIFAVGINDSQFIHSQNSSRCSPPEFKNNLQKLIKLAEKFSSKIIFVGLTPVDETKTLPIPWNTDKSYKNEYIREYNEIIKSVSEEKKIYFIEVFDELMNLDYKDLLADGLHPNSKGHQKIFEIVNNFLVKNKIV
ncbi:MAG: GDSL-type esterase/lipase family protein [bacterium]|nr:GDSL-type esterase/lipase family protein [bacterium]